MKAGTLLFIVADVVQVLEARGILLPSGDFDATKADMLPEDAALASAIEAVLISHGVQVPDVVDGIIQALPLVAMFMRKPKAVPDSAGARHQPAP